jgi:hypothetical protein
MTGMMIYDENTQWGLVEIPVVDFRIATEDNSTMFGDVRIQGMQSKRIEATVVMIPQLSEQFGRLFDARAIHTLELDMSNDTLVIEKCKAVSCNYGNDGEAIITWVAYGNQTMRSAMPTHKSKYTPPEKLDWKEVGF